MKSHHITKEDFLSKSMREIIDDLIEKGAPIKHKTIEKIHISLDDLEIEGNFEIHPDVKGGVTYLWGKSEWFN